MLPFDARQYLDPISRYETVRIIEGLAQEFGILKEGFRGIARHTIGKGLELQLNTRNIKWNEEAELQFEEYAMTPGRFDIMGVRNLYDAQHTAVEQRIFRGEFFAAAVGNPRWVDPLTKLQEPAWQLFDTNEIRTPADHEEAGGTRIFDGVKLDRNNYREGYHVDASDGTRFIPSAAMVHWFQPTGVNQTRGESDFAPVINRLVDWRDLELLFTKHAKTHASLAVAVKKVAKAGRQGAFGAMRRTGTAGGAGDTQDTRALEKAFPGMIAYLGADNEAQVINSSSPSEALGKFITDVLAPNVFASLGIPSEFFWHPTRAGGPAQRFILTRADLLFQVLADKLICTWLNAVAFRFIQHRIKIGRLPEPEDENWSAKMSWQTPARLSIDRGDKQLEIEQLRNGTTNLRTVYDRDGKRWREETRQWIREWMVFEDIAKEEGATPEKIALLMSRWRASQPGSAPAPETEAKPVDESPEQKAA
ncbi:MAG TPA: phage portal protein [Chthoniobacteraceae bacterium]